MTVILNLPLTGVPKRTILDMAFEGCGLAGFDFDRTAEEIVAALRKLNAMMREWPWSLAGYNQPAYGAGLPEELSNIAEGAENAVADELAVRIAPGLGLTVSPEQRAKAATSRSTFVAQFGSLPSSDLAGSTPLGSGSRRWYRGAAFSGRA